MIQEAKISNQEAKASFRKFSSSLFNTIVFTRKFLLHSFKTSKIATFLIYHCCHAPPLTKTTNYQVATPNSKFLPCPSFDNENLLHSLKTIFKVPHFYY
jgi:hypothetical protein